MSQITREQVVAALDTLKESDFKIDLVGQDMISAIEIVENNIKVKLTLPASAYQVKQDIHKLAQKTIKREIPAADAVILTISTGADTAEMVNSIMPGVKNTIAVASGKGGVGKSTVAVNLAVALAKQGAKVGLIDADIYGPSIPLMLGIDKKPQMTSNPYSNKLAPLEAYGIKLMSIGFMVDDDNPVIWRGPMASGAVKQFMSDVDWGELDYLLFDMPPGTGDIQLTLVQTIPLTGSVIVTTPQDVSLIDAKKGLKMFERVNVPVFGIVENMSYFVAPDTGNRYDIFGSGGGEKLAVELGTKFLGGIPIDPRIREGGDTGKPIVDQLPDTENAVKFKEIAANLANTVIAKNKNNGSQGVEINLG